MYLEKFPFCFQERIKGNYSSMYLELIYQKIVNIISKHKTLTEYFEKKTSKDALLGQRPNHGQSYLTEL